MEKYIGLDLGTTTLGIAISDELGIVYGRENFTFERGNYKKAREHLLNLIHKENVKNIVIGLPLTLQGEEGVRVKSVYRFIEDLLKLDNNLNVFYQDERYTTIEAYERMDAMNMKKGNKENLIDMFSAIIILETYLGGLKNGTK